MRHPSAPVWSQNSSGPDRGGTRSRRVTSRGRSGLGTGPDRVLVGRDRGRVTSRDRSGPDIDLARVGPGTQPRHLVRPVRSRTGLDRAGPGRGGAGRERSRLTWGAGSRARAAGTGARGWSVSSVPVPRLGRKGRRRPRLATVRSQSRTWSGLPPELWDQILVRTAISPVRSHNGAGRGRTGPDGAGRGRTGPDGAGRGRTGPDGAGRGRRAGPLAPARSSGIERLNKAPRHDRSIPVAGRPERAAARGTRTGSPARACRIRSQNGTGVGRQSGTWRRAPNPRKPRSAASELETRPRPVPGGAGWSGAVRPGAAPRPATSAGTRRSGGGGRRPGSRRSRGCGPRRTGRPRARRRRARPRGSSTGR